MAASRELGGVAAQDNPIGFASVASNVGQNAFGMASEINKQNDTSGQVAGILGGAASAWLGGGGGNPFSTKTTSPFAATGGYGIAAARLGPTPGTVDITMPAWGDLEGP